MARWVQVGDVLVNLDVVPYLELSHDGTARVATPPGWPVKTVKLTKDQAESLGLAVTWPAPRPSPAGGHSASMMEPPPPRRSGPPLPDDRA